MPFPQPRPTPRPKGRLTTPTPTRDPLTSVDGVATVYSCASLAEVDAHLENLRGRIEQAHALPKLRAQYREDCDRLLERRSWLMVQDDTG